MEAPPENRRCGWTRGKNWRCRRFKTVGTPYCKSHHDLLKKQKSNNEYSSLARWVSTKVYRRRKHQAKRGNFVNNDENEVKDLPLDLINDNILPRLPAKSLIRFTSVCKNWKTLIKSPQFVATHLKLNNRPECEDQYPLILNGNSCYTVKNRMPIFFDKLGLMSELQHTYGIHPPDSCYGLILLKVDYVYTGFEFFLWNPSIRKFKCVDASQPNYKGGSYNVFGLGFHRSSNDYRVVRIEYYPVTLAENVFLEFSTRVEIYSLTTNSWRNVDLNLYGLVGFRGGVFLNGCIHWLANMKLYHDRFMGCFPSKDIESILFFDIEKECFGEIKLPEDMHYGSAELISFKELQGSLAAFFFDFNDDKCSVWVMDEYGVSNSWNIKVTFRLPKHVGFPFGFTNDGMLVCKERKEWGFVRSIMTPPPTKKVRKKDPDYILLDNTDFHQPTKVINYMESLALFE
ncbi:hypothetical protein ACJIZ3_011494 [Penstemon smallii]|uniref:WRC domain-containing protein n=1 Tax=Penstemon smallii TaxID=265156 RepID=A0ABD3UKK3_9LAMI